LIAAIAAVAVVVTSIHWFVPKVAQPPDAFDYLMMDTCDGQDFAAVQKIPAGSIFAPPGMGLKIAQAAHAGVTVSSIPYHRASPGIRHVLQVYMAPGDAERRALLQGFDYFVICRAPTGLSGEKAMPLFASLMKGDPIPGLTPVPDGTKSNVLLFRIEPAATK
jgi:hypothetical protein